MSVVAFLLVFAGLGFVAGSIGAAQHTPSPNGVSTRELLLLALLSAVGGAFSSGQPTLIEPLDVFLRSLIAAAFVLLGSYAKRFALFAGVGAVSAVIMSGAERVLVSRVLLVVVGLTVGVALAHLLARSSPRLFAPTLAFALGQLSLRIPTSAPARLPTLAGVVALVFVAWSGYRQAGSTTRRWTVRFVGVLGGLAVLGSGAGGLTLLRARAAAEEGVSSARQGLALARAGSRDEAELALSAAASSLSKSHSRLRTPIGQVGQIVPVVSQHLRTLDDLTLLASDVVASARLTSGDANMASLKSENGSLNLAEVRALSRSLARTVDTLDRAERRLAQPSEPWIVPQVARRISGLRTEMVDADREARALLALAERLPAILGGDDERRYLLVLPTPAEARGSGGVIGNFGELTAKSGRLSLVKFGRQVDLERGVPPGERSISGPPDFLARYTRFGVASTWSNINMSPDFETVARAMAELYPESGGTAVDGVISADPFVLQALLGILGPLSVPGWSVPLDETNTARILLHDAYVANPDAQEDRISLLADVTTGVWDKIRSSSLPNPRLLVERLAPAARHRNLQIWMKDPVEQRYMRTVGLAGAIPPSGGDTFGVVVNNASANKIEYFLHRSISYDVVLDDATRTIAASLSVALRNDAPSDGLPDYVIGNQVKINPPPRGSSLLYVSCYSPLEFGGFEVDGQSFPESEVERDRESGLNVFSVWVTVPSHSTRTLTLSLRGELPGPRGPYALQVFTQPMVNPDQLVVAVRRGGLDRSVLLDTKDPRSIEALSLG